MRTEGRNVRAQRRWNYLGVDLCFFRSCRRDAIWIWFAHSRVGVPCYHALGGRHSVLVFQRWGCRIQKVAIK